MTTERDTAPPPTWLADNLARVRERIADAARRAGRAPESVRLVAVSKTHSAELVSAAARLGLTDFGENRVQEAQDKIPRVNAAASAPLTWHLIGTLQTNKVRVALGLFDIIQSVDSVKLAEAIARRAEGAAARVLLEVYFGDDPARPGFRPADLPAALEQIGALDRVRLGGLMTVAPLGSSEREAQACFARLREARDVLAARYPELDLRELSMGMTDDYPQAIAEGATLIRVGRALFGARPSPPSSS